ncbi:MAG: DUF362 domain-containing protein [Candidatus Zixiibacteriota bacterium]|nr:MAG: DUF362 domain-containing protein [candidate division Zixibacteria bacterium]
MDKKHEDKSKSGVTRRDFIKGASLAGMAAAFGMPFDISFAEEIVPKTRVVLIRDENVLDTEGNVNAKIIGRMLDEAVTVLLETKNPAETWKKVVNPDDVVGIKSNEWGPLPTPAELEQAIKSRVMEAGVPEDKIAIDDRGVLHNNVFKNSTALINVRPMRTHHWSGVGSLLKNYIMFTPRPDDYHDNSCADLAELWKIPQTRGKTRLNILVVLTPLFHGVGTHHFEPHHFDRKYIWQYKGLLVGTDPVAVDGTGLRIIEAKREQYFGEYRPMKPPPHHIAYADIRHGLGVSDPNKIELVKLGWQDGVLI